MGRIKVPEFLAKGGSGYFRLCLAPSEVDEENNAFHLHPNLLHINMRTNKKTRKVPVSATQVHNTWQEGAYLTIHSARVTIQDLTEKMTGQCI